MPRALNSVGALETMFTDIWQPPQARSVLPQAWRRRLGRRFHEELALAPVKDFSAAALALEVWLRLIVKDPWQQMIKRNHWFQRQCAREMERRQNADRDSARGVFAYSYTALESFRVARRHGWRTVLSQIDGGLRDEELIARAHAATPAGTAKALPAPAAYWERWQEECRLADTIIVNSEWSCDLLMAAGVPSQRLVVVPAGFDADPEAEKTQRTYPEKFSAERPLRLLFLGSFSQRKGALAVLDAMAQLREEPVHFQILADVLVAVPPDLLASPKISWCPRVPHHETGAFYRAADVLLFPTLSDGYGLVQVEARSWKLPVFATRYCAPIVQHERNGLVLPESSGDAITAAVRQILEAPPLLAAISTGWPEESAGYSSANVRRKLLDAGLFGR